MHSSWSRLIFESHSICRNKLRWYWNMWEWNISRVRHGVYYIFRRLDLFSGFSLYIICSWVGLALLEPKKETLLVLAPADYQSATDASPNSFCDIVAIGLPGPPASSSISAESFSSHFPAPCTISSPGFRFDSSRKNRKGATGFSCASRTIFLISSCILYSRVSGSGGTGLRKTTKQLSEQHNNKWEEGLIGVLPW